MPVEAEESVLGHKPQLLEVIRPLRRSPDVTAHLYVGTVGRVSPVVAPHTSINGGPQQAVEQVPDRVGVDPGHRDHPCGFGEVFQFGSTSAGGDAGLGH